MGESAFRYGIPEHIIDPLRDRDLAVLFGEKDLEEFEKLLRSATPDVPVFRFECQLKIRDELRWTRLICQTIWSDDEPAQYRGVIGKAVDIHDDRSKVISLEYQTAHDSLTSLLNANYGKKQIQAKLDLHPKAKFALSVIDVDHFKGINDTRGHLFGNEVLCFVAEKLRQSVRSGDLVIRFGGDEIMLFQEYHDDVEPIVARIFNRLNDTYGDYRISVSMGIATTETVDRTYSALFHAADQALYAVKQAGRGQYRFYDSDLKSIP